MALHDESGGVTLIFYKLGTKWYKEPFLNIVAAAAQMSSLTHVEIALGSDPGRNGEMTNVCRVFNDDVGVASDRVPTRTFALTTNTSTWTAL
jgi:hypothetical protein